METTAVTFQQETRHSTGQLITAQQEKQLLKASLVPIFMAVAEARQATLNEEGLKLYCRELADFDIRDIRLAARQLSTEPRKDGATAYPDLAAWVSLTGKAGVNRRVKEAKEAEAAEEERYLRQWVKERMEDTGEDERSAYEEARKRGYIASNSENIIRHMH